MTAAPVSPLAEPAFRSVPESADTLGPEVGSFCASIGFGPDPDQQMILDAIFAADGRGRASAFETAVVCSRQNLKSGVFKMACLGWLFVTDEKLIVWSAHEWDTIKVDFRQFEELISGTPALDRQVKHIYRGNGDEAIEMKDRRWLIFKTRTKAGGRGLTGDKVILDEAFALRDEHMGAMLPAMSARSMTGDPQVLYGSSAGLAHSAVLRDIRDRGRAGDDPRLAYFEWCAPPPETACRAGEACTHAKAAVGCGCDNPEYWAMANPAMGRRISEEHIRNERRALPVGEFARERMGWWDDPAQGFSPLDAAAWALRADPGSAITGPMALGIEIAPDLSSAAVAAAGRRADGRGHGEITGTAETPDHRPGTGWLVGRVVELAAGYDPVVVALKASGQSRSIVADLVEHGFEVVTPGKDPAADKRPVWILGSSEYAAACGALVREVNDGGWHHLGQGPLDDAAEGARTRPLGEGYAWSQRNSAADICPLVAVTVARHGFATFGTGAARQPFALWG